MQNEIVRFGEFDANLTTGELYSGAFAAPWSTGRFNFSRSWFAGLESW